MLRPYLRHLTVTLIALSMSACAHVDLNEFGIQANNSAPTAITACPAPKLRDASTMRAEFKIATESFDDARQNLPSSLQNSPVLEAIFLNAKRNAAAAIYQKHHVFYTTLLATKQVNGTLAAFGVGPADETEYLNAIGVSDDQEKSAVDQLPKASSLSTKEFRAFRDEFSEQLLRQTGDAPAAATAKDDAFWERMKEYYSDYAEGKFVDYFGNKYAKPDLALTVSDSELANALGVFLEFVFDEAAKTPVWKNGTSYFPGNSSNEPTVLVVNNRTAVPIALDPSNPSNEHYAGCGITLLKAKAMNMLAQNFSGSASSAAGAAVGTIGGAEIGVGFLGKISIGDNKALTSVIQATVAELVKRLTVEATYPVLESVGFSGTESHNQITAFFQSPNKNTPLHYSWLP